FAVINAARLYGVDAEAALNGTCSKFRRRFDYVEAGLREQGRSFSEVTLTDMDSLWDEAKKKGL
ncbi:MAG: nucleoside triphosphate pyrophosphohydrolase, partial [Bacteroidales bacterium]|nr:nucleoside triphosphate pyrophosphohydrolase [Bacteroidales bacterium]